ncbi:MAG TPA: hypothetical protein VNJ52_12090 [Patescibacteria group bacterium]|nr:hypothetical protein [Patescibacteria group bacterium]
MIRLLALPLLLMLVPARGAAQVPVSPPACRLPAGLWQKRQVLQREFDASGGRSASALESIEGIDAQYRRFVFAAGEAYAQKRPEGVNACCDGARGDPEASIFCALIRYRLGGRKDPARFLAALPETPEAAAALVDLGQAASQNAEAQAIAGSPVYAVTDEIFRLMLAGYPGSTATYFYLFHHSGGAYADDVADQLEHYLTGHPAALIRNWPVLRKYWNLSEGITWDVDAGWWQGVIRGFRRACDPGDANCKEILALLEKAARAAGAPQ